MAHRLAASNAAAANEIRKIREQVRASEATGEAEDRGLTRLLKALKRSDDFRASSMTRGGRRVTR